MKDLDFPDFQRAFATYWGRRRIGMVIDNDIAAMVTRTPHALVTMHQHWLEAKATFPADSNLWLLGSPAVTPEIVRRRHASLPAPIAPPPALIGRYAAATSDSAYHVEVGDEPTPMSGRLGNDVRTMGRGWYGLVLSIVALALAFTPLPVLALGLGPLSLVFSIGAELAARRLQPGIGLRILNWTAIALAGLALILSVVMMLSAGGIMPQGFTT